MSAATNYTEWIETIDLKHDEAHKRNREKIREQDARIENNYQYFRGRIEATDSNMQQLKLSIDNISRAPVAIEKLVFSPKVVAVIAGTLLSMYGIFEASTYSLKSSVSAIDIKQEKLATDFTAVKTMLDAKGVMDKARADLQDAQNAAFRNDLNDVKRQMQLLQYDNQTLKDLVRKKGS